MINLWLPDLTQVSGTKYQAIADALGSAIERGALRKGDRLPPQRAVAETLSVDLTTVTKAYDAARRRGLIEARGRAGSFVTGTIQDPILPPPSVDTGMNMPPESPAGLLSRAITETSSALLAGSEMAWLQYAPAGGAPQDRAAGARLLSRYGLPSTEEEVILTAGGQNALHAILTSTLSTGDTVACGRFVYPGFKALAARMKLRLLPLRRLDAATLAAACREQPVRALYVVPTNDNPTATTIDVGEREAIALVARQHNLQVIEDDAYGLLATAPIKPIAAFAPERCWYVASLSKIITPALRLAYVRAPGVGNALRLATDVHETAIMPPPLNAAMVSRWIDDGTFERLVVGMQTEIAWRQNLADSVFGEMARQRSPEGYHVWL
ncbi:MAG: PLP-dependent aminotransferase family protein, partial [Sphingomonas sp.]